MASIAAWNVARVESSVGWPELLVDRAHLLPRAIEDRFDLRGARRVEAEEVHHVDSRGTRAIVRRRHHVGPGDAGGKPEEGEERSAKLLHATSPAR
jgi:hypothetical protein